MKNIFITLILILALISCGKVGPLSLPEDKLDKSLISYPCDKSCMDILEEEKKRQQSLVIQED